MERMLPCSFGFRHNELRIFGRGELVVHRDRIRLALVQLRVHQLGLCISRRDACDKSGLEAEQGFVPVHHNFISTGLLRTVHTNP